MTSRKLVALTILAVAGTVAALFVVARDDAPPGAPSAARPELQTSAVAPSSAGAVEPPPRPETARTGRAAEPSAPDTDTPGAVPRGAWDGEFVVEVVDRESSDPVPHATVRVAPFRDASPPREALTDAQGLASVPWWTGGARLIVRKRGFRTVATTPRAALGSDAFEGDPAVVRLVAAPPLRGRVIDPAGAPVTGARVAVWVPHDLADWDVAQTTGADGAFEFAGIPEDCDVQIAAVAPGCLPRREQVRSVRDATVVIVLGRGATIAGTVRDANGPAAGAIVTVGTGDERGPPARDDEGDRPSDGNREHVEILRTPCRTGPDGRFVLRGFATPRGCVAFARRGADETGESEAFTLALGASREDVEVVLGPRATLRVAVTLPPGYVRDAADPVRVALDRTTHSSLDASGAAEFRSLRPGPHHVVVTANGLPAAERRDEVPPGGVTEWTVALEAARIVRGRVTDAGGAGIGRARVTCTGFPPLFEESASTDADGGFELRGLPAGRGALSVHAAGFLPASVPLAAEATDAGTIELRRAPRATVVVEGVEGSASVRWGSTAPGEGWLRSMRHGPAPAGARFEFDDLPEDTPVDLFVAPAGRPAWIAAGLVFAAGEARDLGTVTLPEPCEIAGRVVADGGAPLENLTVVCRTPPLLAVRAEVGPDGSFRVGNLAARPAAVTATAAGYPSRSVTATPAVRPERVTIRLVRPVPVSGRLVLPPTLLLASGTTIRASPAGGADASADGGGVSGSVYVRLDEDGAFTVHLTPGRWVIGEPAVEEFPVEPATVDVSSHGADGVVLRLR